MNAIERAAEAVYDELFAEMMWGPERVAEIIKRELEKAVPARTPENFGVRDCDDVRIEIWNECRRAFLGAK